MIKEILKEILDGDYQTCIKHPLAAIIETLDGQYIKGWNGPPSRWQGKHECLRAGYPSGEGMEHCPTTHAEIKAITHAAKEGIITEGATIYLNDWFPCDNCAKAISEAGIDKLVTPENPYQDKINYILIPKLQNSSYNFELSEKILRKSNVEIIIDKSIIP